MKYNKRTNIKIIVFVTIAVAVVLTQPSTTTKKNLFPSVTNFLSRNVLILISVNYHTLMNFHDCNDVLMMSPTLLLSISIIRYSVISRFTLCNLGIFRTLVHSKPWHTENPGISRTLAYSEPLYIQITGIFRTRDIFRTLSKIYDGAFCESS